MRLGSEEYLRELQRRTNRDEEYRRLAEKEHDSYTLVLLAEPARGVLEDISVGWIVVKLRIYGGEKGRPSLCLVAPTACGWTS